LSRQRQRNANSQKKAVKFQGHKVDLAPGKNNQKLWQEKRSGIGYWCWKKGQFPEDRGQSR